MKNSDEAVINTIRQIIKEVKQEMKTKKVLTEGKTPQQVFSNHIKEMNKYISENVLKTIKESEK